MGAKPEIMRKLEAPTCEQDNIKTNNNYLKYSVYFGSVSSPLCVCENWKGYVVKHNYVN